MARSNHVLPGSAPTSVAGPHIKFTSPCRPRKVFALIDDALESFGVEAVGVVDSRLRRRLRRMLYRERLGTERSAADFCDLLQQKYFEWTGTYVVDAGS